MTMMTLKTGITGQGQERVVRRKASLTARMKILTWTVIMMPAKPWRKN